MTKKIRPIHQPQLGHFSRRLIFDFCQWLFPRDTELVDHPKFSPKNDHLTIQVLPKPPFSSKFPAFSINFPPSFQHFPVSGQVGENELRDEVPDLPESASPQSPQSAQSPVPLTGRERPPLGPSVSFTVGQKLACD